MSRANDYNAIVRLTRAMACTCAGLTPEERSKKLGEAKSHEEACHYRLMFEAAQEMVLLQDQRNRVIGLYRKAKERRAGEQQKARALDVIDELGLCVFHREKWKGDAQPKWAVRKEDRAGNTVVQVRDADLLTAVMLCANAVTPGTSHVEADDDSIPSTVAE